MIIDNYRRQIRLYAANYRRSECKMASGCARGCVVSPELWHIQLTRGMRCQANSAVGSELFKSAD